MGLIRSFSLFKYFELQFMLLSEGILCTVKPFCLNMFDIHSFNMWSLAMLYTVIYVYLFDLSDMK